jgi:hemoglobin
MSGPRKSKTTSHTDPIRHVIMALLLANLALASMPAGADEPDGAPSLYQRVGGYDFIAKLVDTAFPRVASHPSLQRLFMGHSIDSQLRQRQLIVDALCQATGGPCIYIGRPMKPLHEGLGISESDWAVFIEIIDGALVELDMAEREREDWLTMFDQTFRPDVVERP